MVDVWPTAPSLPSMTIGDYVNVWALAADTFRVESPTSSRVIRGYKLARVVAREKAEKLAPERSPATSC